MVVGGKHANHKPIIMGKLFISQYIRKSQSCMVIAWTFGIVQNIHALRKLIFGP